MSKGPGSAGSCKAGNPVLETAALSGQSARMNTPERRTAPDAPTQAPAPDWTGPALCAAAMATVGTSVVASKLMASSIEPFAATALRHALALPVLALLCAVMRPTWPRLGPRDCLWLVLQAAAGSVGYTVLLIAGTALAPATDAGVAAGTLPCMAALFAAVVLGERPSRSAVLGIALATGGVLMLTLGAAAPVAPGTAPSAGRGVGVALVLLAVACEVIFILGQRKLSVAVSPLAMATLMSAGGLVLAAPVALVCATLERHGSMPPQPAAPDFDATAWIALLWYAWVPTVLGFWLWYAGARRATATQAAASTAVLPLVAVLGAATVLGEPLGWTQGMALRLVVAGVVLASR